MTVANAHLFSTTPLRHQALTTRNPLAHNAFIYSVTTTKIYCRPTCPSRLARRSNIVFHDSPDQAAAAGFRACKRCTPDCERGDAQVLMRERVCRLIKDEIGGGCYGDVVKDELEVERRKWSVKSLAREVGLTESHFCRVFKKMMGMTVGEYKRMIGAEVTGSSGFDEVSRGSSQERMYFITDTGTPSETSWTHGGDIFVLPATTDCFEFIDFDAEVYPS